MRASSIHWRAVALVVGGALAAGCMAGSQSVRARTLMRKQLRVGVVQGITRSYDDDFAFAQPTGETDEHTTPVWLTEIAAHYGLARDFDVGVRVRPFSRGGKLELLYQVVRERTLGVGVALGAGADGFYRSRERIDCAAGGCFSRRYGGLMVDVPLVLSRHLWSRGSLFVAGRYMHLLLWGDERFKSQTGSFSPRVNEKHLSQWGAGWVVGLELEWLWLRFAPQLAGTTTVLPDGNRAHVIYPALEVAGVF